MNRKNLTAAVLAGLAGVAGIAGTAHAVNLNQDGLGEVLIYPYFTSNDGNQTILTVVNTTDEAKAVKVRFLEGFNSREVLDFNLYLSKHDVWVASIVDGAVLGGSGPHLVIPDTSCTVPYLYGMGVEEHGFGLQAFLPYAYTGDNADGGPSDISRAAEGYFEVIEMGQMTGDDGRDADAYDSDDEGRMDSAEAATHVLDEETGESMPADCDLLVRNWTEYVGSATPPDPWDGWWFDDAADSTKCDDDLSDAENVANGCGQTDGDWDVTSGGVTLTIPSSTEANTGGLFGSAAVINVGNGTMFSYDARAVQGFDNTADGIHFVPGTIHPSLNDGDQETAYVIDVSSGVPVVVARDYFEAPDRTVAAVSAVFMHDTLANTFVIEEDLNAATEWVVTFPTKNWYVDSALLGSTSFYTPDPDDAGCNGWDPGEPNPYAPPVYTVGSGPGGQWEPGDDIPDATNTDPATGEDWSTCTPIKDSTDNSAKPPFTSLFDGSACEEVTLRTWDREESPTVEGGEVIPPIVSPAPPGTAPPGEAAFELCYEVNIMRFGEESVFGTTSDLLLSVSDTADAGWGRITLGADDANCVSCGEDDAEVEYEEHQDVHGLRGLPVTGFAAEQYENGTLPGGVLANYGGLFGHKGSVRVESCTLPSGCSSP
jgi:hypothetical protein